MKKIVYMHMAKTAGSSVNRFFGDALGSSNCVNHIERFPFDERVEILNRSAFVSGHIYSSDVFALTQDRDDVYVFTFMREPLRQLASHIHWLDHYNEPDYRAEFDRLNDHLRQLVKAIRAVDFDSAEELDDLLTHLSPWGLRMLDNMQTRYLCGDKRPVPLSLINAATAFRVSGRFDRIGFVEDMEDSLAAIAGDLGLERPNASVPRVNEAKASRAIDITRPLTRTVLGKRIVADQRLYALVRRRQEATSETASKTGDYSAVETSAG